MSLLLVDDDADDLHLLRQTILDINPQMEVLTARNGQDALAMLFDLDLKKPDLIIMDLRMPRMDGRKTLTVIQKDSRLSEIPVIVYTTSQDVHESAELLQMGAVRYITKPDHPDEVYFLLWMALEEFNRR